MGQEEWTAIAVASIGVFLVMASGASAAILVYSFTQNLYQALGIGLAVVTTFVTVAITIYNAARKSK